MCATRGFRRALSFALLALAPTAAVAQTDHGPELGLATGYAFSAGHTGALANANDQNISDYVGGQWPIWIDAGYRFNSSWSAGGYFQYGFGSVNDDQQALCRNANVDCSASDARIGVMGRYHFDPLWRLSPWAGLGFGYESTSFTVHESLLSTTTESSWSGFELVNLQIGADFQVASRFVVAPFAGLSFDQFRRTSTTVLRGSSSAHTEDGLTKESIHEWIVIGARVVFLP